MMVSIVFFLYAVVATAAAADPPSAASTVDGNLLLTATEGAFLSSSLALSFPRARSPLAYSNGGGVGGSIYLEVDVTFSVRTVHAMFS